MTYMYINSIIVYIFFVSLVKRKTKSLFSVAVGFKKYTKYK